MKLSDLSTSPYLASDDYTIGTVMPMVKIERLQFDEVPIPSSTKKQRKVVAYFKGATKGWVMNKTVGRAIARKLSLDTNAIDKTWIGVSLQLVVVGDVRRPDGTKGNAFRLHDAWLPGQEPKAAAGAPAATATDPTTPAGSTPPADGAAP